MEQAPQLLTLPSRLARPGKSSCLPFVALHKGCGVLVALIYQARIPRPLKGECRRLCHQIYRYGDRNQGANTNDCWAGGRGFIVYSCGRFLNTG